MVYLLFPLLFSVLYRIRGGGIITFPKTFLARFIFCFTYGLCIAWILDDPFALLSIPALYLGVSLPWTNEFMGEYTSLTERLSRGFAITAPCALLLCAFNFPAVLFGFSGIAIAAIYHACWKYDVRPFNLGPTESAEYISGFWLGVALLFVGII